MNVLIVAIGSQGDVNPFIKIGIALHNRSHDVTILSNSYFRDLIENAGLNFASVGSIEDYNKMVDEADTTNPVKSVNIIMDYLYFNSMQKTYDAIERLHIPGKTVVLGITMAFGARIAQEKLGVPLITCHLAPISFPSVSRPAKYVGVWMPHWMPGVFKALIWQLIDRVSDMSLAGPVNNLRKNLELPPVRKVFRKWLHSPDKVLGLFPEWFAQHQADWPAASETVGFVFYDDAENKPMPDALTAFIDQGDPPVVFTPGTAVSDASSFFETSVRVCERLNLRGIFLTRYKEGVPKDLNENFHYCEYAPFGKLFPKALAVVHPGGIGTCAQALKAGIPQLIVPIGMDQPDNAYRLMKLGVAHEVPFKKYKSGVAVKKLEMLIDDKGLQKRCKQISGKLIDFDSTSEICRKIETVMILSRNSG